MREKVMHL